MSTEHNKELIRKYFGLINNKDLNAALTSISPNMADHGIRPSMPQGTQGMRIFFGLQFAAFPDIHFTIDDIIAEEDKVVVRVLAQGTNLGSFMAMPPTGKYITWSFIDINRIENDKIVERWIEIDTISVMQQLGIVPPLL